MSEMTSKDRVRTALNHAEPDRVPIDYSANPGIDARLRAHFGLALDDDEGLLRALGVDFRSVTPPYIGPKLHPDEGDVKADEWGMRRRWVEHDTGGYWECCEWPLANATLEEVEAWPLPSPDDFDYATSAARCREHGNFFITTGHPGYGDFINATSMLRTMEQVMLDLATEDEAGMRLMDRRGEILLEVTRRTIEACAACGGIDMLWIGEDLGTQRGPMISLPMFRQHIRPRLQRFVDVARASGVPVMIHSCGSSSWAFDDFHEMGIHAVDTLQPEAINMSPHYLKDRFGSRLMFHGGISTAGPVAYGSVEEVRADIREKLEIWKPNGGYCLAPTHCLQDNSPTANVVAMYESALEWGRYA